MLREAHAVVDDDRFGPHVFVRRRGQCSPRQAARKFQFFPSDVAHIVREIAETGRVFFDEHSIENARGAFDLRALIRFDHRLANADNCRRIAAGLHLVILRADLRRTGLEHLRSGLRIDEAHQARLADGIERDDWHAAFSGFLQIVEHARTVRADILTEEEHQIGMFEVVERDRADAHTDRCREADTRAFVAHVRAVGQIVRTVHACKKLVHVGRFKRCATGCVEHRRVRFQCTQFAADLAKRVCPRNFDVFVQSRVPAHGRTQAARIFQFLVVPSL